MSKDFKPVESKWIGPNLANYKSQHAKTADERGVAKEFAKAQTLTAARKVLFGTKRGSAPLRK